MEKKNVTFDDIAKFTGFSKTTISRFFNKPDSLTEKNQKIIKDALDKLGYQGQNQLARNLAKGKTEYIGVIIPNLYLHYFSHLLNNILQTYEEFGYKFMVFVEGENEEEEKQYIRELMSYQVEGLLMMSHQIPSASLAQLGIPVVGIEREDQFISSVNCDNYAGALEAVRLLESHHCDVYLHINTPTNVLTPAYQRIVGFQDYCSKHHLPNEVIVRSMGNEYGKILPVMTRSASFLPMTRVPTVFSTCWFGNTKHCRPITSWSALMIPRSRRKPCIPFPRSARKPRLLRGRLCGC